MMTVQNGGDSAVCQRKTGVDVYRSKVKRVWSAACAQGEVGVV